MLTPEDQEFIELIQKAAILREGVRSDEPEFYQALSFAVGDEELELLATVITDATDPDFRCPK